MDPALDPSILQNAYGKVAVLIQWAIVASCVCVGAVIFLELVFTPAEKAVAAIRPAWLEGWKGVAGMVKPMLTMPLGAWSVMEAHRADFIELGDGPMGWKKAMLLGFLGTCGAPFVYKKLVRPWLPWANGKPEPPAGGTGE